MRRKRKGFIATLIMCMSVIVGVVWMIVGGTIAHWPVVFLANGVCFLIEAAFTQNASKPRRRKR